MKSFQAAILAGGKNIRFGRDKAMLKYGDTVLLNRIYNEIRKVIQQIWVIGTIRKGTVVPDDRFVPDTIANAGPMGGVYTALSHVLNPVLIIPCDLPFIESIHLEYLIGQFDKSFDATVAVSEKGVEPLFGIYLPKILPQLEENLQKKNYALHKLIEKLKVKFVPFDKAGYIFDLFFNINTLRDYEKALYLKEQVQTHK